MRCIVCDRDDIPDGASRCPDCGFLFIRKAGAGHDAEYQEMMAALAREHADSYMKGTGIGLTVYSYQRKDRDLELRQAEEIMLVDSIGVIPEGEIHWYKEKFARIETDKPLVLTVTAHGPGRVAVHKASVEAPAFRDFWQVGVKQAGMLKCKVVVGRPGEYRETQALSLVRGL